MKKNKTQKKLDLEKFKISKLFGSRYIIGGDAGTIIGVPKPPPPPPINTKSKKCR